MSVTLTKLSGGWWWLWCTGPHQDSVELSPSQLSSFPCFSSSLRIFHDIATVEMASIFLGSLFNDLIYSDDK